MFCWIVYWKTFCFFLGGRGAYATATHCFFTQTLLYYKCIHLTMVRVECGFLARIRFFFRSGSASSSPIPHHYTFVREVGIPILLHENQTSVKNLLLICINLLRQFLILKLNTFPENDFSVGGKLVCFIVVMTPNRCQYC